MFLTLVVVGTKIRPGKEEGERDQRIKLAQKCLENLVMLHFITHKVSLTRYMLIISLLHLKW